jgi:CxxC motif-containing protein
MNKKEITCIVCPIGCKIIIKTNGKKFEILDGNKCKQGVEYARSEALDPRRVLTSSVLVEDGIRPLVSVKTKKPIPKDKVFEVLKQIQRIKVKAPIKIGQVIVKNIANTNIDLIATKTIDKL